MEAFKTQNTVPDRVHLSEIIEMLQTIAGDFNLPEHEILRYMDDLKCDTGLLPSEEATPMDHMDHMDHMCKARKQNGQQCTRRSKEETYFCGKHIKTQKYGCVDLSLNLKPFDYESKQYMMDCDNILYQSCEGPEGSMKIVGKRTKSGGIHLLCEGPV